MIEVEIPKKSIVLEFPDDATEDEINAVIDRDIFVSSDIQPLKTLKEGSKDVIRHSLDFVKGVGDVTRQNVAALDQLPPDDPSKIAIEKLKQDPDVVPGLLALGSEDLVPEEKDLAIQALNSKWLKPDGTLIRPDGFKGYVQDVIRMAPQIGSQLGATLVAGPGAGLAFM